MTRRKFDEGYNVLDDHFDRLPGENIGDPEIKFTSRYAERSTGMSQYAWNSPMARTTIPDVVAFHLMGSGIAGVGATGSFDARFLVRGPEASLLPAITYTQGLGAGADVSVGIGSTAGRYWGNANNIRRNILGNTKDDPIIPGVAMSMGLKGVANVSIGYGGSKYEDSYVSGGSMSVGVGVPTLAGMSISATYTWVLKDYYHR